MSHLHPFITPTGTKCQDMSILLDLACTATLYQLAYTAGSFMGLYGIVYANKYLLPQGSGSFVFQLWRLNTRKVFIWHLNFLAKFWWQELLNFLFEWGEHSSVTFCPDTTILKFWIKKFMYIGERRYLNACKQWRGINCSRWNLHCNSLLQ